MTSEQLVNPKDAHNINRRGFVGKLQIAQGELDLANEPQFTAQSNISFNPQFFPKPVNVNESLDRGTSIKSAVSMPQRELAPPIVITQQVFKQTRQYHKTSDTISQGVQPNDKPFQVIKMPPHTRAISDKPAFDQIDEHHYKIHRASQNMLKSSNGMDSSFQSYSVSASYGREDQNYHYSQPNDQIKKFDGGVRQQEGQNLMHHSQQEYPDQCQQNMAYRNDTNNENEQQRTKRPYRKRERDHRDYITPQFLSKLPAGFSYRPDKNLGAEGNAKQNEHRGGDMIQCGDFLVNIEIVTKHSLMAMRRALPMPEYRLLKNRKSARVCRRKRKAERVDNENQLTTLSKQCKQMRLSIQSQKQEIEALQQQINGQQNEIERLHKELDEKNAIIAAGNFGKQEQTFNGITIQLGVEQLMAIQNQLMDAQKVDSTPMRPAIMQNPQKMDYERSDDSSKNLMQIQSSQNQKQTIQTQSQKQIQQHQNEQIIQEPNHMAPMMSSNQKLQSQPPQSEMLYQIQDNSEQVQNVQEKPSPKPKDIFKVEPVRNNWRRKQNQTSQHGQNSKQPVRPNNEQTESMQTKQQYYTQRDQYQVRQQQEFENTSGWQNKQEPPFVRDNQFYTSSIGQNQSQVNQQSQQKDYKKLSGESTEPFGNMRPQRRSNSRERHTSTLRDNSRFAGQQSVSPQDFKLVTNQNVYHIKPNSGQSQNYDSDWHSQHYMSAPEFDKQNFNPKHVKKSYQNPQMYKESRNQHYASDAQVPSNLSKFHSQQVKYMDQKQTRHHEIKEFDSHRGPQNQVEQNQYQHTSFKTIQPQNIEYQTRESSRHFKKQQEHPLDATSHSGTSKISASNMLITQNFDEEKSKVFNRTSSFNKKLSADYKSYNQYEIISKPQRDSSYGYQVPTPRSEYTPMEGQFNYQKPKECPSTYSGEFGGLFGKQQNINNAQDQFSNDGQVTQKQYQIRQTSSISGPFRNYAQTKIFDQEYHEKN